MFVIGTAGHVDHGKSSLVLALTGIDPDRLKEEKERELTIDLGFAWMKSKDDQGEIGIVDVPGHIDFIENMLAGVGGIDLALLVIAADEGVMPQTKEHLAIIDLLDIDRAIIALTKIDLVDDEDWIELVSLEISESLTGTVMENAPIVNVSASTGQGVNALRELIWKELEEIEEKTDRGQPRLPIDRVFTLSGFGTIVTGTLLDGQLSIGQAVEVQPAEVQGRIRGLQTHKTKIEIAQPGSRVAVNISGIDKDAVERGNVLAQPGVISGTILCDVDYKHLQEAKDPLQHNQNVKFFSGAAEVVARTRVIGRKQINPGESGWLQLAFAESIALQKDDRFIIRRPSPSATLGGGRVLDPHPGRRHKRYRQDVADRYQTLEAGQPSDLLIETLNRQGFMGKNDLISRSGLSNQEAEEALSQLLELHQIRKINDLYLTAARWNRLKDRAQLILKSFHEDSPLRIGIQRQELRSRLTLSIPLFNTMLGEMVDSSVIEIDEKFVRLPEHKIVFSDVENQEINKLMSMFREGGVNSPSVKQAKTVVGEDIYFALIDLRKLVAVSQEVVYRNADYEQYIQLIIEYLENNEKINAAELRDLLGTSRKYAIALLENLDDQGITRRVGDERILAHQHSTNSV